MFREDCLGGRSVSLWSAPTILLWGGGGEPQELEKFIFLGGGGYLIRKLCQGSLQEFNVKFVTKYLGP